VRFGAAAAASHPRPTARRRAVANMTKIEEILIIQIADLAFC
jgi:hypothetical protein